MFLVLDFKTAELKLRPISHNNRAVASQNNNNNNKNASACFSLDSTIKDLC